ncbi:hypothetical protein MHU86_7713 [Fragilaria crotonensis]|nr:hypothetical protein MHU86_7713 [Fragilaria crotonensis]
MPEYPPLSCLSDLTEMTFHRNSSIADSIGTSIATTDASDSTATTTTTNTATTTNNNDVDNHMVVAGGNNIVQGTGMPPPTTLTTTTTASTSSPSCWNSADECRFQQTCYECLVEANFWDEDSIREEESKTTLDHYTIITGTPAPSTLILTGNPLVYAIPPAYYHAGTKSCRETLSGGDRGLSSARQTWGLPML